LGDGKNNFTSLSAKASGVYLPFDSRTINTIQIKDKKGYLITNNNDSLKYLEKNIRFFFN